jgi:DNA-binding IclR family transcriptional regulator
MIQSVDRALSLLSRIADHPEAKYGLRELTEFMELDKSSVHRLLSTLMKYGLVRQAESRKAYQLGFGIYSLAAALRDQLKITELASPLLKRLALATKENAHLAVRSGTRAVFIDRERATKAIAANTNIGDSEELHCTAVGKCLICGMIGKELALLFEEVELTRYTEATIVEIGKLEEELALVAARGFAMDDGEYEPNVMCIAAPVYNFERKVEASIGISGPRERMAAQSDAFAEEVRTAGEELSERLGGGRQKDKTVEVPQLDLEMPFLRGFPREGVLIPIPREVPPRSIADEV